MIDLPIGHSRPNDARGFLHKKFLRVVSKVAGVASSVGLPGAGIVSRVSAFAGGRRTAPRTLTARVTPFSQREKELGRQLKFGPEAAPRSRSSLRTSGRLTNVARQNGELLGGDPECVIPGMRVDPGTGKCKFFLGERAGPDGGFALGEPVLGLYGAGVTPGSMVIDRAVCGKKMQLGDDGVCYNKSQISNKQRMWPAGRRPLLTGGDMRAISIASRAGKRMDGATARLRKLGMMKKAPVARAAPKPATVHEQIAIAHALK